MAERRPRPSDYADTARYYTALLMWLDYRYDDRVDRARKFHKITQKEDAMPVKRETGPKTKTAQQVAADEQVDGMLEQYVGRPEREARARIGKLIARDSLTDAEQDELDALIIERQGNRRHRKAFGALLAKADAEWAERSSDAEFVAKWQRYAVEHKSIHGKPGEPKLEHWYWTITHSKEAKRIRRRQKHYERIVEAILEPYRQAADAKRSAPEAAKVAEAVAEREARKTARQNGGALPGSYTAPAPAESTASHEAAPRRKRQRVGIVAQYDLNFNRIE